MPTWDILMQTKKSHVNIPHWDLPLDSMNSEQTTPTLAFANLLPADLLGRWPLLCVPKLFIIFNFSNKKQEEIKQMFFFVFHTKSIHNNDNANCFIYVTRVNWCGPTYLTDTAIRPQRVLTASMLPLIALQNNFYLFQWHYQWALKREVQRLLADDVDDMCIRQHSRNIIQTDVNKVRLTSH